MITPTKRGLCGGSIISSYTILTAAHCTVNREAKNIIVRVGSKYYNLGGELFRVRKIVNHPDYDPVTKKFDIALLHLTKKITMKPGEKEIIKLADKDEEVDDGSLMMVSGWGDTLNINESTLMLRGVEVPVVNQEKCKEVYSNLSDEMLCAGYFDEGGKDSCQGENNFLTFDL